MTAALIIATLASYFVFAYPSILSLLLFVMVVPVFSMLGVGFFKIAQEEFLKSKQAPRGTVSSGTIPGPEI